MDKKLDIFDSVKSRAVNEITPEILETGLDAILTNEALKDIPIVGLAFKGFGLYQNISEGFFVKKLLTFLHKVNEIPFETRKEYISKLESEDKTKKAGEKLLITLNRLDDIDKSSIVGCLFKNTILGNIKYDDFSQLSHMIDNCYVNDLIKLKYNPRLARLEESTLSRLYKVGFLDQKISDVKRQLQHERRIRFDEHYDGIIQPKFEYSLNIFADILIEYGFESQTKE